MKKQFALLLVSLLCSLACIFALTGCKDTTDNTGSSDTETSTDTATDTGSAHTGTDTDIPADTESETKTDETTDAPHTEHTYDDWVVTTEATCKDTGVKTRTCSVCGNTETEDIPVISTHTYGDWVVTTEPTCKDTGVKTRTCSVCGNTETEDIPVIATHTYGNWAVTKAATCKDTGVKTRTCSVCGNTETENIPVTSTHTYGDWVVTTEPTCKDTGVKARTCSVCGNTETEDIPVIATHTYGDWVVTTEPTCKDTGVKTRTCSVCGNTETEDIPATSTHTYGDWVVTKAATCKDTGVKTRTCSVCGDTEKENIPVTTNHTYGNWAVTKAATCKDTGIKKRTCSVCLNTETEDIPVTNIHAYGDWILVKEPTSESTGTEKRTCSICGNTITKDISLDSSGDKCTAGEKNIASEALSISVVDSYGNVQDSGAGKRIDLAYITDGKTDTGTYSPKIRNFSICITYLNENTFNKIVATINGSGTLYGYSEGKPLETDVYNIQNIQFIFYDMDGIKVYETENFDTSGLKEVFLDNISVRASKIEMKVKVISGEPSWNGLAYIWEVETYAEVGSHAYVYDSESSVAPTCTKEGKRAYKCECGDVKEETIPASGIHTWDEGTVTTPATDTTPGVKTFTCTVCQATTTEAIPATGGHNWDAGTVVDPTCTDRGYTLYKCTDAACEETYKDNFVNALGHDFDTGVLVKRSSVTEKGKMKYTCKRSGCGYSYTDDLPLARYSDAISVIKSYNVKSATATSNYSGGAQSWAKISDSDVNNIIDGNTRTIWASGATGGTATIELDYEYVAIGCKLYVWSNYNTFMIDFFDESGKSVLPVKTVKDSNGNVTEEYTYIKLSNVHMTDGYEKTPINLSEDINLKRIKKIVITVPNGIKWEGIGLQIAELELTVHKCQYEESEKTAVVPADCVNKTNGSFHGTCYVCGEERDVFVPYSDAHQYKYGGWVVTKEPTCKDTGVKAHTCTICNHTETEAIPMNEHIYGDWVVTKPTCKNKGVKTRTCSVCSNIETEEIPMNGHIYGDWVVTKTATCEDIGIKVRTCTVCNYTEAVEILPSHTYGNWVVTKEATCKDTGIKTRTCSVCGDTETENIPVTTNHTYGDWVVTKEATCKDTGAKTRTCSVCGDTEKENIPVTTNHTYGNWAVTKAATCKDTGVKAHTCTICNHTETEATEATGIHNLDNEGECTICGDFIEFTLNLDNSSYSITAYEGTTPKMVIPSEYKGLPVTTIGNNAFKGCSSLTSVTIPDSVTSIGSLAFYGCSGLKEVFYKGTESEWSAINIDSYNDDLTSATVYYYSETEPTGAGNYWHYDTDGKTILKWE